MIRPLTLAIFLLLKPPAIPPEAPCVRVVDGDTIVVEDETGKRVSVRLLGVDTPETVHPRKPVEPWGPEASAYLKSRLGGASVRLVVDPAAGEVDRYGRRLAWVFLGDECLNETIVREGHGRAYVSDYPVDPVMGVKLRLLESTAKAERRGLWKAERD